MQNHMGFPTLPKQHLYWGPVVHLQTSESNYIHIKQCNIYIYTHTLLFCILKLLFMGWTEKHSLNCVFNFLVEKTSLPGWMG
jgi:hypothetical protein